MSLVKCFIMPGSFYFDYFTYMQEMMTWQREHPEVPVINIYFEDVKKVNPTHVYHYR